MGIRELRRRLLGAERVQRLRRLRRALKREPPLPAVELTPAHVAHLVVVADRQELLRRMPRDGVVAEVGVDRGDFSARILELAGPRTLHLVDLWGQGAQEDERGQLVQRRFEGEARSGRVRFHRGLSHEILQTFPDHSLDWVYIDTDHSFATTRLELEVCGSKVRPDGIIAGHDYVTGNWSSGVRYGVVEAVHQFCVERRWEFVGLTAETDRHLSFALRRMAGIGVKS